MDNRGGWTVIFYRDVHMCLSDVHYITTIKKLCVYTEQKNGLKL